MRNATAAYKARPFQTDAPRFIVRVPAGAGVVDVAGEYTSAADLEAVFDRLPLEWQQELRLHWLDRRDFGTILEYALERAAQAAGAPIVIEPFENAHRMIFRSAPVGVDAAPGYVLAWKQDACIEIVWGGTIKRVAMYAPDSSLATAYYWGALPAELQAELTAQGWTPKQFHDLVDDAQADASEAAGFYGLQLISLEFVYSQSPRTPGKLHVLVTAGVDGDVSDDLARFDPQLGAIADGEGSAWH